MLHMKLSKCAGSRSNYLHRINLQCYLQRRKLQEKGNTRYTQPCPQKNRNYEKKIKWRRWGGERGRREMGSTVMAQVTNGHAPPIGFIFKKPVNLIDWKLLCSRPSPISLFPNESSQRGELTSWNTHWNSGFFLCVLVRPSSDDVIGISTLVNSWSKLSRWRAGVCKFFTI